jgi:DNA invertase Pin-like site-specific DNA recombinase
VRPLERPREGIAKAQREGKYKGRAPAVRRRAIEIVRLKETGVTPTEIAVRLGIGLASVYGVLAEHLTDHGSLRDQQANVRPLVPLGRNLIPLGV